MELAQNALALVDEVLIPTALELRWALKAFDPKREDFNDRLILETMRSRGLSTLVTAEQPFPQAEGLQILSPQVFANQLSSEAYGKP